jgi:hypothetical protein
MINRNCLRTWNKKNNASKVSYVIPTEAGDLWMVNSFRTVSKEDIWALE